MRVHARELTDVDESEDLLTVLPFRPVGIDDHAGKVILCDDRSFGDKVWEETHQLMTPTPREASVREQNSYQEAYTGFRAPAWTLISTSSFISFGTSVSLSSKALAGTPLRTTTQALCFVGIEEEDCSVMVGREEVDGGGKGKR